MSIAGPNRIVKPAQPAALSSRRGSLRSVLRYRRWLMLVLACGAALLLSGCLLTSGEQTASDAHPTGGNSSSTFVSAEGVQERTLATGANATAMNVIVIITAQEGGLQVEMLDPQGSVTLSVQGRPGEQVTRSGITTTDAQGNLRYRVSAQGARNGSFQVLYQPAGQ